MRGPAQGRGSRCATAAGAVLALRRCAAAAGAALALRHARALAAAHLPAGARPASVRRHAKKEKRGEEGREAERRLLVTGGWPVFQRELAGAVGRRRSSGGAEQDGEEKAEGEKRRGERRGQRDLGFPARSSVGGSRNGCRSFRYCALPKR